MSRQQKKEGEKGRLHYPSMRLHVIPLLLPHFPLPIFLLLVVLSNVACRLLPVACCLLPAACASPATFVVIMCTGQNLRLFASSPNVCASSSMPASVPSVCLTVCVRVC